MQASEDRAHSVQRWPMSRDTINVRVDDELKKELRELSYDYRMEHSELVRKILTEGAKRWRKDFEARGKDGQ